MIGCSFSFGTLSSKAVAEDLFESLRLELSLIGSQIEDLRVSLLSPEIRSLAPSDAGIALLRLDALESKLRSTLGRVEAIEFHLDILSKDAIHRMEKFSLKLEQLERKKEGLNSKNIDSIDDVTMEEKKLNGISGETLAFDKAILSFNVKDFETALNQLKAFEALYPESINIAESYYWQGLANMELRNFTGSANAFLEAFSRDPSGIFAWKSLLGLATSLSDLGQSEQGCLTLEELKSRFPKKVNQNLAKVLLAEEQMKCSL